MAKGRWRHQLLTLLLLLHPRWMQRPMLLLLRKPLLLLLALRHICFRGDNWDKHHWRTRRGHRLNNGHQLGS